MDGSHDTMAARHMKRTYQLEYGYFHHTLVEVCGFVFYYLHGYNFVCLHVLTLDDLTECTLPQNI